MLSGLSRCGGGAGTLGVWAGLSIDISASPLAVPPAPAAGSQAAVFNDLNAPCYFRTNDSTFWQLFAANRTLGDVALIPHKGDNAWAFYAESGCRIVPSGGGGFAGVDPLVLYEGLEVFMDYTGPDVSIDPAGNTMPTTAPQEMRFIWDNGIPGIDSMWVTRSSAWMDDTTAATGDWTLTMDFINRASSNPTVDVYEAYLHCFAVPVTSGVITTSIPP